MSRVLVLTDEAYAALSTLLDINDDDETLADAGVDPTGLRDLRRTVAVTR